MRPIKFRAWDEEFKKMRRVLEIHYCNTGVFGVVVAVDLGNGKHEERYIEGEKAKLVEFTGLHDKNGKGIWEGDILKRTGGYENKVIVEWSNKKAGFEDFQNFDYGMSGSGQFYLEVIGNIYENPGLLK